MLKWHHRHDTGILDSGWHWTFQQYHKKAGMYVLDLKTLMDLELVWGIVIASQEKGGIHPVHPGKGYSHLQMGQVTKLWLSCYLVLLSIDSKTR